VLLAVALLLTVSVAGHAASGDLVPLAIVTDLVHLGGVSVWLGGLAVLVAVVLRGRAPSDDAKDGDTRDADADTHDEGPSDALDRPGGAATGPAAGPTATAIDAAPATTAVDAATLDRVVGRFSSVAFAAVVAIVVSGVVQAWRQLGSLSALVDTPYGRLLVVKVVLVALMVGVAGLSRAWVRRRLAPAGAPGAGPADAAGLRRSVAAEVAIAVAVLAVTAGLVQAVPGDRAGADDAGVAGPAGAAGAAGAGAPYTTEMHGEEVLVEATVGPTATGPTTVDIAARDHGGDPIDPEEVTATLRLPAQALGPIDLSLTEEGTGEFTSEGAELPFAGEWELVVTVRTSDIDQDRLVTTFTVS
jgi:copper transport protein